MEGSSINRGGVNDQEESGWTAYFHDFSNQTDADDHSFCSSSMVSDAASFPAWKFSYYDNSNTKNNQELGGSPTMPKRLTFKKTRAKEISHHDDSLEDTASSPVNSPKVSDIGLLDTNSRVTNDNFNSSLGKGASLEHFGEVMETEERSEQLKRRGLCLFPLSMLVHHLG